MRVLVCGGRRYGEPLDKTEGYANAEVDYLYSVLDSYHGATPLTEIIHGGATGADSWAGRWARKNKVKETVFHADWRNYGKSAGAIRNRLMARQNPDAVLAFPGGKGTADMVKIATQKGLHLQCYELP